MKRRSFLSTATFGAVGAYGTRLTGELAPTVVAQPTVFYAHDGERSLVRFTITGLDAPAGRLRIYDTRSRLIGTAGVINTGVELIGELWLRLGSNLTLVSALEAPGLRGVHRTTHRVPQGPRWTIHWLTIADPSQIDRVIGTAPPHAQAIRGSIARAAGVHANPGNPITYLATDPLDAFESVRAAGSAQVHGLPTSRVALETSGNRLDQTSVMMLAGSGVEYVIRPWHGGAPHEWWEGMDGSRILAIPQAPSGDLGSLGFDESATTAQARVDRWLTGSPIHLAPLDANGRVTNDRITYVIDTDIERAADRKIAVDAWNARFGYPRVVMGPPDNPLDVAHQSRESIPSIRTTRTSLNLDDATSFRAAVDLGNGRVSRRSADLLAAILVNGRRGIEAVAADIRTDFPGHVVFNSGPFPRTDVMDVAGENQLVTDIPPHGYALLLDLGEQAAPPRAGSNAMTAESSRHRVRINEHDGSIASIVSRDSELEWVGAGMNVIDGARLDRLTQDVLPGRGVRVTTERRVPTVGRVRSIVTLFDGVPWISVRNEPMGDAGHIECRFQFSKLPLEVLWDRGFGHHQSSLPTADFDFARWVWLRGETNGYLWSTAHRGWVSDDGTFGSPGPVAGRFRIMAEALPATLADPARFGWRTLDLLQHPVRANPKGRLPRFGSLLELDQPSAAIIAIEPTDRFATSATVYVQDLLGAGRMIGIEKGLLDFTDAQVVDYRGRRMERELEQRATGVRVFVPPSGITAVRLHGLRLRDA